MTRTDTTTRAVCALVEQEIGWYGLPLPDGEPTVTPDTRLDDMGADSLDRMELRIAVELAFGVESSDEEWAAVQTVADIVAIVARRELDALRDVGERASRENARMIRVVDAALTWWRRHRPVEWDEAEHLRYPLVNTTTDAEKNLARAVADYVAAHGHKTENA